MVLVEMTTRRVVLAWPTERRRAPGRQRLLPVPVPASTIRWWPFEKGAGHGAQHLDLLRAVFVSWEIAGQTAHRIPAAQPLVQVQGAGRCRRAARRDEGGSGAQAEERAVVARVRRRRGCTGCSARARRTWLKTQRAAPIERLAQADELGEQVDRQLQRLLEEVDVDGMGDAGVVQGAVGGREQDAQRLGQRAQVVAAGGRQQDGGQLVGIEHIVISAGCPPAAGKERSKRTLCPKTGESPTKSARSRMTARIGGALRTISLVIPVSWVIMAGIGLPGLTRVDHSASTR